MTDNDLKRWRLILGGDDADATGVALSAEEQRIDSALSTVYDANSKGGLEASAPKICYWLGEIKSLFPQSVAEVIQKDVVKQLNIKQLLSVPELMDSVVPDMNLLTTVMSLGTAIPAKNKEVVRHIARAVIDQVLQRLSLPIAQAVSGAHVSSARRRNPRLADVDWNATIHRNLRNYQPDYKTIIPEVTIGRSRRRRQLKDVILCVDQSGSMASSLVYSAVIASVMAAIPSVSTSFVVFDTSVVDLTDQLSDPAELLMGVQLGGGTDINQALKYCQSLIHRPSDTVLILVTDLYEGGDDRPMQQSMADIAASGVNLIGLLALSDNGTPSYDHANARYMASLGCPVFSCSPDKFPDLLSAALSNRPISQN